MPKLQNGDNCLIEKALEKWCKSFHKGQALDLSSPRPANTLISNKLWKPNDHTRFCWKVFEYPAYTPELSPFDYRIFGIYRNSSSGEHFHSDNVLKEAVQDVPK